MRERLGAPSGGLGQPQLAMCGWPPGCSKLALEAAGPKTSPSCLAPNLESSRFRGKARKPAWGTLRRVGAATAGYVWVASWLLRNWPWRPRARKRAQVVLRRIWNLVDSGRGPRRRLGPPSGSLGQAQLAMCGLPPVCFETAPGGRGPKNGPKLSFGESGIWSIREEGLEVVLGHLQAAWAGYSRP